LGIKRNSNHWKVQAVIFARIAFVEPLDRSLSDQELEEVMEATERLAELKMTLEQS